MGSDRIRQSSSRLSVTRVMYIRANIYIAGSDNNDIDAVYINGATVALLVFVFYSWSFVFYS